MNKKIVIMILLGLTINISSFAQLNKNDNEINRFNEKGQKEGFWVDSTSYRVYEHYYENGMLNGVSKKYNTDGKLLTLGEYKKGKQAGTWYFFEVSGQVYMIFKDFEKNTNSVINGNGERYIPDYKCYFISYYPNGNIESEGILVWSEGEFPESDLSKEYGEWKYYDDKGNLIKTKEFK